MFRHYLLDLNDDQNIDFDNLLKKTMRLLGAKKKLANMVQVEKNSQGVEDLVKKCNYKTRISSTSNRVITLSSTDLPASQFSGYHSY